MNYPVPPFTDSPEQRVQCKALRPVQDDAHHLGLGRGKCGAQRPIGTECFNVGTCEKVPQEGRPHGAAVRIYCLLRATGYWAPRDELRRVLGGQAVRVNVAISSVVGSRPLDCRLPRTSSRCSPA